MIKLFTFLFFCLALPVSAQTLSFEKGTVYWTDGSAGKAETELKLRAEDKTLTVTVAPGLTSYAFADSFKTSLSTWICGQNRHKYPDGTFSNWYISETEGLCKQMADVMPPIIIPPIEPPPPPPPPPPVVKPAEVSSLRVSGRIGNQVELTWSLTEGATSYTVKYINTKGGLTLMVSGITGTTALVNLPNTGKRLFVVCAVNSAGETCPVKLQGAFATR